MGLIMLILVGTVPTAYALNHTVGKGDMDRFAVVSGQVAGALDHYKSEGTVIGGAETELPELRSEQEV